MINTNYTSREEREAPITDQGRLLIVDDQIADSLARYFKAEGLEIIVAKTKSEGIEKALKYKPKVVSLDNYMPADEDDREITPYGNEIARAIRQHLPRTHIVGLSSEPDSLERSIFDRIFHKSRDLQTYIGTVLAYYGKPYNP